MSAEVPNPVVVLSKAVVLYLLQLANENASGNAYLPLPGYTVINPHGEPEKVILIGAQSEGHKAVTVH